MSRVYHVHCSRQLKTPVTIRIQHSAPQNVQNLCFITCSGDRPPYEYTILHGGTFTSDYGELVVSKFSFYMIGQLFSRFRVRGVLSLLEKSYEASLYCSSAPRLECPGYCCDIYISVVKNCGIFEKCVKSYIKEAYGKDVKLLQRQIVRFDGMNRDVIAKMICETRLPADIYLDEPDCIFLRKTVISGYVDACPPHLKFCLHYKPGCPLKVKFVLEGLQDSNTFTLRHSDIPGTMFLAVNVCFYHIIAFF